MSLFDKLRAIGDRLTRPVEAVQQPEQRRRAQLLASLLLFILLLALVVVGVSLWVEGIRSFDIRLALELAPLLLLVVAYPLSRTRHYPLAAALVIGGLILTILAFVIWNGVPHRADELIYLIVPVLLGSLFFSWRVVLAIGVISMGAVVALTLLPPALDLYDTPLGFLAIVFASIMLAAYQHTRLERARRAELAESEQRFRLLAENAQDVIFRYRLAPPAGYEYVSPAARQVTGYSSDEFLADPLLHSKLLEIRDDSGCPFDLSSLQGRPLIARLTRRDGSQIWVEQRSVVLVGPDGTPVAVEGVVRDVTDRQQAGQALARRLAETQVLREVMLAASSTLNFDQVLQRACETLGNEMQVEYLGVVLFDAQAGALHVHPSLLGYDPSAPQAIIPLEHSICGRVWRTGEAALVGQVRDDPDYCAGAPEVQSELAVPIRACGDVVGVLNVESSQPNAFGTEELAFYTAIGGQLGIAMENARLYGEVSRQAAELAAAVAQLRELDQLKSEFIQNVSHELRAPLALIRGYAELLAAGDLGPLLPEQRGPVDIIVRRTIMLSGLVQDIVLALSLEINPPPAEPVALDELAHMTVEEFRVAADQAGLTLCSEIETGLLLVDSYRPYLRRVLDNLIGNAIKFTPEGGTITVRVKRQGSQALLEVADTGIGIASEEQERVFHRFYQVDGGVRRHYGGVGLGLALVKEIVETYGGSVTVKSQLNQGTTFTVCLLVSQG